MRQRNFDFLAVAGIFVAYSATTRVALGVDLVQCLLGGAANTIPVVIFGVAVRRIIVGRLLGKPLEIQLAAHLVLCAAFCALSYCLLIVLLGLFNGAGPNGFVVRPFPVSGTAWQSLENVTTYALIAAVSHLQALNNVSHASRQAPTAAGTGIKPRELAAAGADSESQPGEAGVWTTLPVDCLPRAITEPEAESGADAGISRYFVRIGEELRPLDIDTVVSINGADDYAEVRTMTGKHLVRVTLTDFAKSLDPSKYVRVHRSWIVNTHRVARAEPAGGGRLLLHMETGQTISTSRDGAKLLRNRVL
jgi:DNA-binding LytR/AlgR family response regulator